MSTAIQPVRVSVVVQRHPAAAFEPFGEGFGGWWSREYTWGRDVLEWIGLEPKAGGRCSEQGAAGCQDAMALDQGWPWILRRYADMLLGWHPW